MKMQAKRTFAVFVLLCFAGGEIAGQKHQDLVVRLTTLQDNFVSKIKKAGFTPALTPPAIMFDNPETFGNYDETTNTLHTTDDWSLASGDIMGFFTGAARTFDSSITPQAFFERATHKWIFIHELGHWWRNCQKQKATHYDEEMGANRIAVAYWRDADPEFMKWQLHIFESFIQFAVSPVPAGTTKEQYLNDNFESVATDSRAYTWYQAQMIVQAYYEKPERSFAEVIRNSGN